MSPTVIPCADDTGLSETHPRVNRDVFPVVDGFSGHDACILASVDRSTDGGMDVTTGDAACYRATSHHQRPGGPGADTSTGPRPDPKGWREHPTQPSKAPLPDLSTPSRRPRLVEGTVEAGRVLRPPSPCAIAHEERKRQAGTQWPLAWRWPGRDFDVLAILRAEG